jgi:large subunit ribosomal protein L1
MARGKRYREAYEKIDRTRAYAPAEAIRLIKQTAGAKFDETVELHVRLGVNVRHAEEQLRGTLALPKGLGKEVTIAVFAEGDVAGQATEAGADFVGSDDLAERIEGGWTDFDVAIAHPSQMPKVGKLGRILGPQGKMPNPKVGTVTEDIAKAVEEAKAGKVEYRTDRQAIVHLAIGKTSFSEEDLLENYAAVVEEIIRAKPAAAKGRYIISITLSSTMGPGVRVDAARIRRGEIMLGAGASADGETPKEVEAPAGEAASEGSDEEPAEAEEASAEGAATA